MTIDTDHIWSLFERLEYELSGATATLSAGARTARIAELRQCAGKHYGPDEHSAWCARMFADGWKHGDVLDDGLRTNPDLVPWSQLCADTKARLTRFYIVADYADAVIGEIEASQP